MTTNHPLHVYLSDKLQAQTIVHFFVLHLYDSYNK